MSIEFSVLISFTIKSIFDPDKSKLVVVVVVTFVLIAFDIDSKHVKEYRLDVVQASVSVKFKIFLRF